MAQRDAPRNRRCRGGDADRGATDAAVPRDLARDEIGGVGGNREADPLRAHDDGRIDADHLPCRGHQRAARIAGIERGVGLHDVLDHPPGARLQRATERGNDAGRDGRVEAERIADRYGDLSALQPGAVAQFRGRERDGLVDAQQRQIGVGIVAEHARLILPAFQRGQHDVPSALHDMRIGQSEPVRRNDDAGPRSRPLGAAPHVDAHDARPDAIDNLGHDAGIGVERKIVGGSRIRGGGAGLAIEGFVGGDCV